MIHMIHIRRCVVYDKTQVRVSRVCTFLKRASPIQIIYKMKSYNEKNVVVTLLYFCINKNTFSIMC